VTATELVYGVRSAHDCVQVYRRRMCATDSYSGESPLNRKFPTAQQYTRRKSFPLFGGRRLKVVQHGTACDDKLEIRYDNVLIVTGGGGLIRLGAYIIQRCFTADVYARGGACRAPRHRVSAPLPWCVR